MRRFGVLIGAKWLICDVYQWSVTENVGKMQNNTV